jgi:outer membrane protein insertion porin family
MILRIFLTLFLLSSAVEAQKPLSIALPQGVEPSFWQLKTVTPFRLGKLTYQADIAFEADEFYYLVDFQPGELLTPERLIKAFGYLAKKNKFLSIGLQFRPQGDEVDLHVVLKSRWTFKRLYVRGVAYGRDSFAQQYELEPGDPFDQKKHAYSLSKIAKFLHAQGYLAATVKDSMVYEAATKEVVVSIEIHRSRRFLVDEVKVVVQGTSSPELNQAIHDTFVIPIQGRRYQQSVIEKHTSALTSMLAQKGYLQATVGVDEKADIQERSISIVVKITLNERRLFEFQGAQQVPEADLRAELVNLGTSAVLLPPGMLCEELIRLYRTRGFLAVEIDAKELGNKTIFTIREGKPATFASVQLRGMSSYDISHMTKRFFGHLLKNAYLEEPIQKAVDSLLYFYRSEGFWDVQLLEQSWNAGTLSLYVDEGPRYYLRSLKVPGFENLIPQLVPQIALQAPLNMEQFLLQRRWLLEHFLKGGYLYVDIKPQVSLESVGPIRMVDVTWNIIPRQTVGFGKAVVAGVSPIPFAHFLKELQFQPGMAWDKERVDQTVTKLRELDLFDVVHVYPDQMVLPASDKPIMIRAVPSDPLEVRLRAGALGVSKNLVWKEGATYKIGGSVAYRNPFNCCGQFRLDGDVTKFEQRVALQYRHPWLFGLPYRTLVKGYYNRYMQPVMLGQMLPLYIAIQQGCVLSLSRKMKGVILGLNTGFEWLETSVQNDAAARAINFLPVLNKVQVPYVYIEPTLVLDGLDDKVNPTVGAFTLASLKGMVPLGVKGTTPFLKLLVEQSFFSTIFRSVVGGIRFRFGHVFNTEFSQIMPPDRFLLGGAWSVRGYEPDHVPPLGRLCDPTTGRIILVPQGGRTMCNLNIEIRFPLFNKLSGALFQDAGVLLGDSFASAVKERMVAGSGFGLRYNTPVGPLRFDLGFKWRKIRPEDSRVAWYLTLGNAF